MTKNKAQKEYINRLREGKVVVEIGRVEKFVILSKDKHLVVKLLNQLKGECSEH